MFEDDSDDEESSLDQLEQLEPPSEAEGKVGPLEVMYNVLFGSFGLSTKEPIQSCFVRRWRRRHWHLCTPLLATGLNIKNFRFVIHMHLFPFARQIFSDSDL